MNRGPWYVAGVIGIVLVLSLIWYLAGPHLPPTQPQQPSAATTTNADLTGSSLYANGEFGFSMTYPASATVDNVFSQTAGHLPALWRVGALNNATGTPIVAVITYSTESDHSFPRYFVAQVRIGASKDKQEVARCLKAENGETALPDAVINGTAWKVFSFADAATMQYLKSTSYRSVHDGMCFALEQIARGSSYHDDPPSADDIPQKTLDAKYDALGSIFQSFSFVRP